jgi:hypothetical protein
LKINGSVNLDTTGNSFDTLVIRRVNGITDFSDYIMNLSEVQIWVDYKNLLFESSSRLTSSIVSWSDKDLDIGYQSDAPPSILYANIRTYFTSWVLSPVNSPSDVAIIIKNIQLTKITETQSIQFFNSTFSSLLYYDISIGLTIELYSSVNDPNFNTMLAHSSEFIKRWSVYRFDFPSIDTYSLLFSGSTIFPNIGSYSNLVFLGDATLNSYQFNILENVDVDGTLTASSAIINGVDVDMNTT